MVGLLDSIEDRVTMSFKDEGDSIYLLGKTKEELGASQYLKFKEERVDGDVPDIDLTLEAKVQKTLRKAVKAGIVKSAHDCSEGGLAVALAESCFEHEIGAKIEIKEEVSDKALLFGESQSRIILSLDKNDEDKLTKIAKNNEIPYQKIGYTKSDKLQFNNLLNLNVKEMKTEWETAIENKV